MIKLHTHVKVLQEILKMLLLINMLKDERLILKDLKFSKFLKEYRLEQIFL